MRALGQGVAFIDSIAETLGPLDLEPSSSESMRPRALCASKTSRRLGIGGAPTAAADGADAFDPCVYRLNLEYEPQLPAPRSLHTTGPMGKSNMAPERVLNLTIDSGASFHIVNNPNILINKRPSNETISGVDRCEHRCTHIGDLPITAQDEAGAAHRLTIYNVRCVPSITDSLFSILKLWDDERFDCLFRDVCAFCTPGGLSSPFQREHGGAGLGIWSVQVQSDQLKPPKLTSERRDASPFVWKRASTIRSEPPTPRQTERS